MDTAQQSLDAEIDALEQQIEALKAKRTEARRLRERELVSDYEFETLDGKVRLSELFGERNDLLVIHNMGRSCSYCTLWADGLNGLTSHLESRSAFVVISPDTAEVQRDFAEQRGWRFRMVSAANTPFTKDMGFYKEAEGYWPGASAFVKDGDSIYRVNRCIFGPGDDYCAVWPLIDMLDSGSRDWEPKLSY